MNYVTTKTYRPAGLISDMDRMLNQMFDTGRSPSVRGFSADIAENTESYLIKANLPGFSAEDVDVQIDDNLLIIEAKELESTSDEDTKDKNQDNLKWYVRERRSGTLKRSFVLPDDVERNEIQADMKNGVLTVILSKKPTAKPFAVKVRNLK